MTIDASLKQLNTCFNLIKEQLIEYLSTIDISTTAKKTDIENHFENILKIKEADGSNQILFLNFNYTSTIELYTIPYSSSFISLNYIHGKLNDNKNPIIFGYGDEMDIYYNRMERLNNNEFLKNIKSFGYFKTRNYQSFSEFMSRGKFDVYIMGHSCGLSDRILLNSIFTNKNFQTIRIFFYQKSESENDYFEKTQQISRHFPSDLKGEMRNKILTFPFCRALCRN